MLFFSGDSTNGPEFLGMVTGFWSGSDKPVGRIIARVYYKIPRNAFRDARYLDVAWYGATDPQFIVVCPD